MALLIVFGGNTDTEQVVEKACAKLVGSYDEGRPHLGRGSFLPGDPAACEAQQQQLFFG